MGEACAVCIKPCFHGGKCLVAALDFDVGEAFSWYQAVFKTARFLICSKCWEVVLEETPLLEMSRPQLGELQ